MATSTPVLTATQHFDLPSLPNFRFFFVVLDVFVVELDVCDDVLFADLSLFFHRINIVIYFVNLNQFLSRIVYNTPTHEYVLKSTLTQTQTRTT